MAVRAWDQLLIVWLPEPLTADQIYELDDWLISISDQDIRAQRATQLYPCGPYYVPASRPPALPQGYRWVTQTAAPE